MIYYSFEHNDLAKIMKETINQFIFMSLSQLIYSILACSHMGLSSFQSTYRSNEENLSCQEAHLESQMYMCTGITMP